MILSRRPSKGGYLVLDPGPVVHDEAEMKGGVHLPMPAGSRTRKAASLRVSAEGIR
jgi:hypothetical protein